MTNDVSRQQALGKCETCEGFGRIELEPDSLKFHPCEDCCPFEHDHWKKFEQAKEAFREIYKQIPKSRQTDLDNVFRRQNVNGFLDQLQNAALQQPEVTAPVQTYRMNEQEQAAMNEAHLKSVKIVTAPVDVEELKRQMLNDFGGNGHVSTDQLEDMAWVIDWINEQGHLSGRDEWVEINTVEDMPKKVTKSYEQYDCIIWINGEPEHAVWNCEHLCWDDYSGDDFRYDPLEPSHYLLITPPKEQL